MRLLLESSSMMALAYARDNLVPLAPKYEQEIFRLSACLAYAPLSRLQGSPYADLQKMKSAASGSNHTLPNQTSNSLTKAIDAAASKATQSAPTSIRSETSRWNVYIK